MPDAPDTLRLTGPIRDRANYERIVRALRSLFDQDPLEVPRLQIYTQFGFYGYHMVLTQSIQDTLDYINKTAEGVPGVFDNEMVLRWKVVNELLLTQGRPDVDIAPFLKNYLSSVAATCAFPALEEIARRLSGVWNEEGLLLCDTTDADGLYRRSRDNSLEPVYLKAGSRIVGLQHKLQLLRSSLHTGFQASIDSLDQLTQRSFIQGVEEPLSPLFERLAYYRNAWAHGGLYTGWEAHLVSLLIGLLYYRHLPRSASAMASIPEVPPNPRLELPRP